MAILWHFVVIIAIIILELSWWVCLSDTMWTNTAMRSLLVILWRIITIQHNAMVIAGCFEGEIHFFSVFGLLSLLSFLLSWFSHKIITNNTTPGVYSDVIWVSLSHTTRLPCGGDVVVGIFVIFLLLFVKIFFLSLLSTKIVHFSATMQQNM